MEASISEFPFYYFPPWARALEAYVASQTSSFEGQRHVKEVLKLAKSMNKSYLSVK